MKVPPHVRKFVADELANRLFDPTHKDHYELCPMCGQTIWRMGTPDAGKTPVVSETFSENLCSMCEQFRFHHPAVFMWMEKVVKFNRFLSEKPG